MLHLSVCQLATTKCIVTCRCTANTPIQRPPNILAVAVPSQVEEIMRLLREDFPDAHIIASTFDAFARPLSRAVRRGLSLPVVTEEIGDTCVVSLMSALLIRS